MRDEMDARLWVDHHQAFSDSVGRLADAVGNVFAAIGVALRKLNQIEFDAPWRRDAAHRAGRA
jgi:hypothetical protein